MVQTKALMKTAEIRWTGKVQYSRVMAVG